MNFIFSLLQKKDLNLCIMEHFATYIQALYIMLSVATNANVLQFHSICSPKRCLETALLERAL